MDLRLLAFAQAQWSEMGMGNVMEEFSKMIAEGARIREQRAQEARQAAYRLHVEELFSNHSVDDLKALWSEFVASEYALDEVQGYCIYKIMVALDQRGEGDLCRY